MTEPEAEIVSRFTKILKATQQAKALICVKFGELKWIKRSKHRFQKQWKERDYFSNNFSVFDKHISQHEDVSEMAFR